MRRASFFVLASVCLPALSGDAKSTPSVGLQVTYTDNGLQQLSYNGLVLEDTDNDPSDAFRIGHMKLTDLSGNLLSGSQYDWGESNSSRRWNPSTHTWTYSFIWGTIAVQFSQSGDSLNMHVTTENFSNSGVIFHGACIYPFVLRFPQLPAGFTDSSREHLASNTTGPSVTLADFGSGEVVSVVPDASKPLYSGFEPAGDGNDYYPIISSTSLDNMATSFPHNDRQVAPGQTDSFTVSLRFAAAGTPLANLAADVYTNWAQTWPPVLQWPDRRIIGTVFLASSPQGNKAIGYPINPRRYFNGSNPIDFDIRTRNGLAQFQARILQQANTTVQNLRNLNAQGAITWDIEGEQYPKPISYVCEPDEIAQAAPEMESIVMDGLSPYNGMKLDDAYFKTMTDAGFRVGVCVRPQHFTLYPDGTASQVYLSETQIATELIRKMQYAHDRWGATLFYVDSSVTVNGDTLDADIFKQVATALPDSLIILEESTPKYYAYTAPLSSFIFHNDLGTTGDVFNYYPNAFSVNVIDDVDPAKLLQSRQELTDAVRRGDILMVHADYWHDNNSTVAQIYQDASSTGGPRAPATVPTAAQVMSPAVISPALSSSLSAPPIVNDSSAISNGSSEIPSNDEPNATLGGFPISLTFPLSGQTLSGTIKVMASIGQPLSSAGSYLIVDGAKIGTERVTNEPFTYEFDSSTLSTGLHTLQISATDINNVHLVSNPVQITIVH